MPGLLICKEKHQKRIGRLLVHGLGKWPARHLFFIQRDCCAYVFLYMNNLHSSDEYLSRSKCFAGVGIPDFFTQPHNVESVT